MKTSRKIISAMLVAAGLATAGAIAYADPEVYGPGSGACFYGAGPGTMGGYGPGMMGGGWGSRGGYGPGMMGGGWGPHHGYGPGMMGYGGGYGPGMAGAQGGPAANANAHLTFLKTELEITTEQESAWKDYAKQVKQQAESMQALYAKATATAQSAPEQLNQRAEFAKQRAAHMASMSAALKSLYTVLTPEQKTIADQYSGGMRFSQFNQRGYGRGR